jgi:hypothetical protein
MAAKESTKLRSDIILPMNQPWMEHIAAGRKNFEFRKYRISDEVKRIWFYVYRIFAKSGICLVDLSSNQLWAQSRPMRHNFAAANCDSLSRSQIEPLNRSQGPAY